MDERLITLDENYTSTFIAIRDEYLAACNGDACAAALLDYFEQFTLWKQQQGYSDADWVYISQSELPARLRGMWSLWKIKSTLKWLRDVGYLECRRNENYKYDRKLQYRFNSDAISAAIQLSIAAQSTTPLAENNHSISWIQPMDKLETTNREDGNSQSESLDLFTKNHPLETDRQKSSSSATDAPAQPQEIDDDDNQSIDDCHNVKFSPSSISIRPRSMIRTPPQPPTHPPSSAHPPSNIVDKFARNIGPVGEQVKIALAAACELYGTENVLSAISKAATFGGRSWAYVDSVLRDSAATAAPAKSSTDGKRYITGAYAAWIEH